MKETTTKRQEKNSTLKNIELTQRGQERSNRGTKNKRQMRKKSF